MRDFKFKIFNKLSKNTEEVKGISFYENDFVVRPRCLKTKKMLELVNSSECILLQYTGLKDKNGVEIYEGDIVKFHTGDICEVMFTGGSFELLIRKGKYKDDYLVFPRSKNFDELSEVIGNIYENKELLDV